MHLRRTAWLTTLVLLTVAGVALMWLFRGVAIVFLVSLAVAAAFRPPAVYLAKRGVPTGVGLLAGYGITLGVLVASILLLGTPLLAEVHNASDAVADLYEHVVTEWPQGTVLQQTVSQTLPPLEVLYEEFTGTSAASLVTSVLQVTLSLAGIVSSAFFVVVLSIYWSADQAHFERLWLSLLPSQPRAHARNMWRSIEAGVGAYIRSETIQSFVAALLLGSGYWAMGIRYPILLALTGAVLRLFPVVGAVLAAIPVVVVGLMDGVAVAAVGSGYTFLILALLEVFVEPRIFHRREYSSILIVLVMLAMFEAFGLPGLIAGPPTAAAIQILWRELLSPKPATVILEQPRLALRGLEARYEALKREIADMEGEPEEATLQMVSRLGSLIEQAKAALA